MDFTNNTHSSIRSIFRQDENKATEANFQVENMRQKLKRTKMANKRKSTNYKKIETFDTLTNVDANVDANNNKADNTPLREGFEDDEYEGHYIAKETTSYTLNVSLVDGIENIYKYITSLNTYLATTFTSALSGGRHTQSDVDEIENYLATLESVWVASYVVYNWYFLMYYAKDNAIDVAKLSRDDLKSGDNIIIKALMFFVEYGVLIVETLNNILLNHIPNKIGKYMNGSSKIILLFIFIIYGVKNFASGFKTFLVDSLRFNITGAIPALLLAYVIFQFIYTIADDSIQSSVDPSRSKPLIMRAFEMGYIASPLVMAGIIFYYLIRILIIIFISLPVGCILSGIYLLFYSFFGKSYYTKSTTYDDLDRHSNEGSPIRYDDCNDNLITGWTKWLMLLIFKFFDGIKANSFLLILLLIIMFSSSGLYSNLSDVRSFIPEVMFRDIMGIYNGIAMITIASIIYSKWFSKVESVDISNQ
jgi:cell fate (sporulation/competence/biofilm development) regulator YmcA (YheA/YmcA/DUF963 family)